MSDQVALVMKVIGVLAVAVLVRIIVARTVPARPAALLLIIRIRFVMATVNALAAHVAIPPMVLIHLTALPAIGVFGLFGPALMALARSLTLVMSINVLVPPAAVPALLPARIMNLLIYPTLMSGGTERRCLPGYHQHILIVALPVLAVASSSHTG